MKKILIMTLALMLLNVSLLAHKEEMHQYITREAYDLLKMSFPTGFTGLNEFEMYVGNDEKEHNFWESSGDSKIVAGAWYEDKYDIMYHYGFFRTPNYNNIPWWAEEVLFGSSEKNRLAHTSITHFWNADQGENSSTHLSATLSGDLGQSTWEFTISENAMLKFRKYWNGNYEGRWKAFDTFQWSGVPYYGFGNDFLTPSLLDIYNGIGTMDATQYMAVDLNMHMTDVPILHLSNMEEEARKFIAYNCLGRMCHLLQDMSVPAHVHSTAHPGNIDTIFGVIAQHSDYFEDHEMDYLENYHAWTASEVYNEFGSMIDPYVHDDPLYYLMYFMNQITDHYADCKVNGDDNYDSSIPGLSSIISTLGAPTFTNEINEANCQAMYDVLIPYAIRVTAGLMYWFAVETDQIDPLPEPVLVSGNVSLNGGNGDITSVSIKFDSQSYGINNVYLTPDENGNFSHVFNSDEFDTYDITYKLYSTTGDYYLVPINDVVITAPLTLPDVTLHPIIDPTYLAVSNNPNITNAFRNIQDAVDYLSAHNSGTINILLGTYTGDRNKNISWHPDMQPDGLHITIRGFGESIIDCEESGVAFNFNLPSYYQYNENDIIDNLIIQNADQGIVIDYGSPIIKNNTIENCTLPDGSENKNGVGISCKSSATIENNTIRNNIGDWRDEEGYRTCGGGIYVENNTSNITLIKNNIVYGNSAYNGGGIYCTGSGKIILDGNEVTENTLEAGSTFYWPGEGIGVYSVNCDDLEIRNNLICDNIPFDIALGYSLACLSCEDVIIENNTIVNNENQVGIKLKTSNPAIINNNIVSNNKYGIYRSSLAIPIITYCCVSNNDINNYYQVTSGIGCLEEDVDPHLDPQTYQPLWNSTTKSPCIDIGDPALPLDPDNTPADIGAIRTIDHKIETIELIDATVGINWKCFPVLDDVYAEEDIAANVLYDIMLPPIPAALELVETQGGLNDITYYGDEWQHDEQEFTSVKGYKLTMNESATLEITGFVEYPEQTINLVAGGENWIGYFLEESMDPFDALAEVLDKINRITTRTFTYIKLANNSWMGIGHLPRVPTLNYGDLVIVNCTENGSFFWGQNGGGTVPKETRSSSQDFTYTEEADYIPVYVELDLEALGNPTEIGIFVENECKGAEVIEDTLVQIRAYVFNDSLIFDPGSVEFQLSYGSRSENVLIDSYTIKESLDDAGKIEKLDFSETQNSYYLISLSEPENNIPEIIKTSLGQNYPNPFNPSTTIAYSILNDGMIELKVYNIKGQLVKTLVKGEQQAGSYETVWNGKDNNEKNISSGVYFYKLLTKDKTIMKKMLMLK